VSFSITLFQNGVTHSYLQKVFVISLQLQKDSVNDRSRVRQLPEVPPIPASAAAASSELQEVCDLLSGSTLCYVCYNDFRLCMLPGCRHIVS